MTLSTETVIRGFIAAINAHDVAAILKASAPDHRFVDAHGQGVEAPALAAAWTGYFEFMPRYSITVHAVIVDGEAGAVFGEACGGLAPRDGRERTWRRPCAWRAEVRAGRVRLWQVYVDTKAVFDLL